MPDAVPHRTFGIASVFPNGIAHAAMPVAARFFEKIFMVRA